MFSNAIGASTTAIDDSKTNSNDTSDGPTSWTLDVITCPTCGGILPADTTTSRTVECPRCQEVTTVTTKMKDE